MGKIIKLQPNITFLYEKKISEEPLLTSEEENRLTELVKSGDLKALELIVRANLRFVVGIAKNHQGKGLSLPDLINEGNLGLINACMKFDHTKGFKFIAFAIFHIKKSIVDAIEENK